MRPTSPSADQQRRLRAAPFGLLLLGWGLGLGPLAHAVVAHGDPVLHDSGDWGWVDHRSGAGGQPSGPGPSAPTHRHAPGALEHLRLAIVAAAAVPVVALLLVSVRAVPVPVWRAPVLARWRLPEVPCGP